MNFCHFSVKILMVSFQKPLCMGLNTTVLRLDTFCLMVSAWNVSRISANRKLALDESNRWETAEAWPLKRWVLGNTPRSQASLRSYLNVVTRSCMSHGQTWFIFWLSNCRKPSSISIFVTDDKVLLLRYLPEVFDFQRTSLRTKSIPGVSERHRQMRAGAAEVKGLHWAEV